MEEGEPVEDIISLANEPLPTECPIFQTHLDSENYGDLLSPFETPPNKYISIDPLPCASDRSPGKKEGNDPLVFPEGSPVTPQLQESSTILSETDFEGPENRSPFNSKLLHEQSGQEFHWQKRSLTISKIQTKATEQHKSQFRQIMDTDFQELLELGKAMNLPSGPRVGTSSLYVTESGGTEEVQNESSDNIALLPFPLDEIFAPFTKERTVEDEQNYADHNTIFVTSSATKTCPESPAIVNSEIGTSHQSLVSNQQCNPMPANIDEVLLEVASRNSRGFKRELAMKITHCDETSTGAASKKRKTSCSTGEIDGEGDSSCTTTQSAGQGKKSSKKGPGYCRMISEKAGKANTSSGSTPSRFCHICTRAAKPDVILVCGNVARGTCRKVICFKCVRDMTWDWSSLMDEIWTCTHCREGCPAKAQCHTYRRVNQNRRADGRRSRKATNETPAQQKSTDHRSN